MKKLLILLSLLICSCAMETANEIPTEDIWPVVVDVYSEKIKEVSTECEGWLENTVILETGDIIPETGSVISDFNGFGRYRARHGNTGNFSYVWCSDHYDADKVTACFGHEYLHALEFCMSGFNDSDGTHKNDKLWCDRGALCVDFLGTVTNSVEFKVTSILQVMAR